MKKRFKASHSGSSGQGVLAFFCCLGRWPPTEAIFGSNRYEIPKAYNDDGSLPEKGFAS
jgi:hypothetical protein